MDETHPLFPDGDVLVNQSGAVWFLSGLPGSDDTPGGVLREITIPDNVGLFFPLSNAECSEFEPTESGFHGGDAAERTACAEGWMSHVTELAAEIDGEPVASLNDYYTVSDDFEIGPLPADNLLGAPEGAVTRAVDAGYNLLLEPLPLGHHTIHFRADLDTEPPQTWEATYEIQVEPAEL